MAHELSFNEEAGVYEACYVGTQNEVWHKLGQYIESKDATVDRMQAESRMLYSIQSAPVVYNVDGNLKTDDNLIVQYRSDTGASLGVVGAGFETTQPAAVFDLLESIRQDIGAQWDAAFALFGGKKIVCQLKLDAPAIEVIKGDLSYSYLTFACACDGTMPRSIWLSDIRAVCNNMLSYSFSKAQKDKLGRLFRQSHKSEFDATLLRDAVMMSQEARQEQAEILRAMSAITLPVDDAIAALAGIMGKPLTGREEDKKTGKPKVSKPETEIMTLYTGEAMGYQFAGQTVYGLLNSITEYVDHWYGRSADARINSALMGPNAALKERAFATLQELV